MKRQPRVARDRNRAVPAARLWGRVSDHPRTGIALVALVAAIVSCYPVVFSGKSFVSPNNSGATLLLYPRFPTLPGYDNTSLDDTRGSDLGAMMWQNRSYSVIQSRALFHDSEVPLWNRYNSSGTPLLGQGISMLGDPLHLIVLSAGGAAWAWDLKFVLAKFLFASGVGLMVWAATRHIGASLLLAFSSVFIGFFAYRFNHPAFFSLCYAPWILYCWLEFVRASSTRSSVGWLAGLVLVNWIEMASGTIKEAYMLVVFLNLCGFLVWLLSERDRQAKLRQGLLIVWVGVLFTLISAPLWLTFWDALGHAYTSYNTPSARQIPPSLLIGLFDDIFYRPFNRFNPSANFLVLLGVVWSLVGFKDLRRIRTYLAVGASALIPLSLAFGLVPSSLIVRVPFLGNVVHIDDTFSCVLIIHLFVLAGFGFKAFWESLDREGWWRDWVASLLTMGGLLGIYFGMSVATPKSAFFYRYGALLVAAFVALPFLVRAITLHRTVVSGRVLLVLLSVVALHWRYGMHLNTGFTAFDEYVMNPQVRVDLQAISPTIESIKSDHTQPFRVVGFWPTLYPGYNGALALESIYGADPLINPYYRELIHASGMEEIWDWQLVVRGDTLQQLQPVYDFLNVKYYVAPLQTAHSGPGQRDLQVYRSNSVWPRAFFTDRLVRYDTASVFADMVRNSQGAPFAAIQGKDVGGSPVLRELLENRSAAHVVAASGYDLTSNTTTFTVDASGKGIVVLGEAFLDQDFRVTLNGEPAEYLRVNHAFKGVLVEKPGTYTVRFSYWPRHFTLSLWASSLGVALLGLTMVYAGQSVAQPRGVRVPVLDS